MMQEEIVKGLCKFGEFLVGFFYPFEQLTYQESMVLLCIGIVPVVMSLITLFPILRANDIVRVRGYKRDWVVLTFFVTLAFVWISVLVGACAHYDNEMLKPLIIDGQDARSWYWFCYQDFKHVPEVSYWDANLYVYVFFPILYTLFCAISGYFIKKEYYKHTGVRKPRITFNNIATVMHRSIFKLFIIMNILVLSSLVRYNIDRYITKFYPPVYEEDVATS